MDLKDIKAIIDLMKKNSISEFELERQDFKIKLKRGGNAPVAQYDDSLTLIPPVASVTTVATSPISAPHAPAILTG